MAQPRAHPLRKLTRTEREVLLRISQSRSHRALEVAHAKEILAVAEGKTYQEAALAAGMRSRHAVSSLVRRFNEKGTDALELEHAGGPAVVYDDEKKKRILREFDRQPDREKDGTSHWSIKTLQKALRNADDGLPTVSEETIWITLHEAGKSWQKDRSWMETGRALRKRKDGSVVEVVDVDKDAKKNLSKRPIQ